MFRGMSKIKRSLVILLSALVVMLFVTVAVGVNYANGILNRLSADVGADGVNNSWKDLFEDPDEEVVEAEATEPPVNEVAAEVPEEDLSDPDFMAYERETEENIKNILLCGIDSRSVTGTDGRSDAIMIASINMNTGVVKLISLMRDTEVDIPGHATQKLAHAANLGTALLSVQTVNLNYNMDIEDAASVNFYDMADIVDLLGGVNVTVTNAEKDAINKNLIEINRKLKLSDSHGALKESGENILLTGKQSVAFARIRKIGDDFKRTERQRQVLEALLKKALSEVKSNPTKLFSLIDKISAMVKTSLDREEIIEIATAIITHNLGSIEQLRLPAEGDYSSGTYNGTYLIRPDWEATRLKLDEFIYGNKSAEEVLEMDLDGDGDVNGDSDEDVIGSAVDNIVADTPDTGTAAGASSGNSASDENGNSGTGIKLESGIGAGGT